LNMLSIFLVKVWYMQDIFLAGQGLGTSLAPQTVSSQRLKLTDFNVLTSCPKDELHQWFLGLYGERIIPAIVHRYTQVLQRPDLIWHDRNGVAHPIMSNESVARVFRRLADRLQGVVADTSMMTISSEYAAHFLEVCVKKTENAKLTGDRVRFLMLTLPFLVRDLIAP
jgi:hypothetical protein